MAPLPFRAKFSRLHSLWSVVDLKSQVFLFDTLQCYQNCHGKLYLIFWVSFNYSTLCGRFQFLICHSVWDISFNLFFNEHGVIYIVRTKFVNCFFIRRME